jgi:hypothetical protein
MTISSTEERALTLLGQGLGVEIVSSAIGVSPSRISQLLSDPVFSAKVAEARFSALAKHNERDDAYDRMESKLQEKLEDLIPFMIKPMEVLKAIQVINTAKRRGISSPEQITGSQNVVQLVMPSVVVNNYMAPQIETNINNQVVKVGSQDLVTVQSASMENMLNKHKTVLLERKNHVFSESTPPQAT